MSDEDVLDAVKQTLSGVRMDLPIEAIEPRRDAHDAAALRLVVAEVLHHLLADLTHGRERSDVPWIQMLGTGLWDNPRVFASPTLQGGLYAAPDPSGFRSFSSRYRTRFGGDPVRTATLTYDAVALVAALARTQGPQRFAPETLTNPSGFAGIDGLFRFRSDGTNERGLAVMKVTTNGGVPVAGSPKSFGA